MVVTGQIPHILVRAGHGPGWLTSNLSDFRELLIYYVVVLYTYDLTGRAARTRHRKGIALAPPPTDALAGG